MPAIDDYQLLRAIKKGSLSLKLKKLRALGFIEGPLPALGLKLTADGEQELEKLHTLQPREEEDPRTPSKGTGPARRPATR